MTETNNSITEETAKAYVALGKLEYIIFKGSIPKDEIKLSVYRIKTIFDTLTYASQIDLNKDVIIDTYNALDELKHLALKDIQRNIEKYEIGSCVNIIRTALPPKPVPTMADIEWNDEKHFLAEAEHSEYGKVIMIGDAHLHTLVIDTRDDITKTKYVDSARLTPTGRRYTLTD